jgi:hypothetical protein
MLIAGKLSDQIDIGQEIVSRNHRRVTIFSVEASIAQGAPQIASYGADPS